MGFKAGLKAFTAAVLGGIGNIYGAMLGGLSSASSSHDHRVHPAARLQRWKNVWAFVLLILVLLVRPPQGLLGERVADRA